MRSTEWSLGRVVRDNAAAFGDQVALTSEGGQVTWRELDERSSRAAHALAAEGVGPNSRVAFLDKNTPEFFDVLMGAGKLGAVMVPVNWRLAPAEMAHIIEDSTATVLVIGAEYTASVKEIGPDLTQVKRTVVLGPEYEDWLSAHPATDPGYESKPEDVAIQLYTSGTTGLPKGAMLVNANFGAILDQVVGPWRLDPSSVSAVAMPLFHIGGSGWALAGMTVGARSVVIREMVPADLIRIFETEKVTNAFLVPAVLQMVCATEGVEKADFSALRAIKYGASPITDEALKRAIATFGCEFIQLYGLTETTGAITQLDAADHDPGGPRSRLLRSVGKPYPWVEIRIVDPDSGQERPAGEVGELWAKGPQTMKGYWNKPEDPHRVIDAEGWFRTGDAGFRDEDGYIFLTDRIKDMIVSGGENIYPAEVENALASHPAVGDVAVIGVPDERWGETPKAMVVLRPDAEAGPEQARSIMDFARERLAHYKCPTSVEFIEVLPRNPSGKVLKRELREPYWEGRARRVN
ncbi:MAG TPA: long-chain-fatty-acid--CoA ligase [Acidimicrobiales bacterium]|nr:long-chain-fatty-acid--CoA ligase [Acidimicrobiales bacterium]